MPDYLVALLGVITGFVLSEISTFLRSWFKGRQYRMALIDELNSNLYQLAQKEDIARQIRNELEKLLPGLSVPFSSTVYDAHFPSIIHRFTSLERDNIRHIYSNLKTLDQIMSSFEDSYKHDVQASVIGDPKSAYIGRVEDVLGNYGILRILITSLLEGKPVDIYHRNSRRT